MCSKAFSVCASTAGRCLDIGIYRSSRMRYYLVIISLSLAAIYLLLGYLEPSYALWTSLVVARFVFLACADCLGEGLIVMIRKLEEDAKEFMDEIDNVNIVGTYLVARGFSRAVASSLGAYCGLNLDMRITYMVFTVWPAGMAFFSRELFFELKVEDEEDNVTNRSILDEIKNGLECFRKTISVKVLITHFSILILAGVLPVGDLAHRQLFLKNVPQTSGEVILLVYLYQSILTYCLMGYVVMHYSKINKKYITAIGLALILLSTLPPLIMANCSNKLKESTLMLLFLSTLFHLFSHLGMNLISLAYFSLLLPFSDRTFSHLSLPSGIFRGALYLQPMVEKSLTNWLSRSAVAVGCWTLVSGLLATYMASEDNPDASAEEAIILDTYRRSTKEKLQADEEKGFILDFSPGETSGLETSSEDPIKHF